VAPFEFLAASAGAWLVSADANGARRNGYLGCTPVVEEAMDRDRCFAEFVEALRSVIHSPSGNVVKHCCDRHQTVADGGGAFDERLPRRLTQRHA
jgi:hypothetical protein